MSACQQIAQKEDNDRYLCCLFAPADQREALFALLAFNAEVAKIGVVAREEMLGLIRLTWWREGLQEITSHSPPRRHDVVLALSDAVHKFSLTQEYFDRILTARELDLQKTPPATLVELVQYAEDTSSPLLYLWLEVLGVKEEVMMHVAKHLGIAWSLLGILRTVAHHTQREHYIIPVEIMTKHGITDRMLADRLVTNEFRTAIADIHAVAMEHLLELRKYRADMCRETLPLCLLHTAAAHFANRIAGKKFNVFDPALEDGRTLLHLKLLRRGIFA